MKEHKCTVRASISFPDHQYTRLQEIARRNRVSLAWVIRDAVEQYLAAENPLFATPSDRPQEESR